MRARVLALFVSTLLGCDPGTPEQLARVEQANIAGGNADDVFGQVGFNVGTEPPEVSHETAHFPAALATDVAPLPGTAPLLWVADRNANRVLGLAPYKALHSAWYVLGQLSFEVREPNGGGAVSAATMNTPSAVAFMRNSALAVADTGNHRVLLGQPLTGIPWRVLAVFGQGNSFDTAERNKGSAITADTLAEPAGVAFDPAENARLIVADTGNNRILIYAPLAVDGAEPINTTAKICIGQEDCTKGLPNRGGAVGRNTLNEPHGVATYNEIGDPLRGFYVADTGNHRVLHFPIHSAVPDLVYGQLDDFTTAIPTKGGPSARSLRAPTGVAVDRDGSLWIADTGHHRVLHFPRGKTVADLVLGQPNMTSVASPTTASSTTLRAPEGVASTPGDVFIADTAFSRVLRYGRPCDDATCDDGNPCTNDACTPSGCVNTVVTFPIACHGHMCAKNACVPCSGTANCQLPYKCFNGVCAIPCGGDTTCPGDNRCVDGFCCDRACSGPCESCAVPGSVGRCTVVEGPPPAGRSCSSTEECGGHCNGRDGSRCYEARAGDPCGVQACFDGVAHTPGVCSFDGTCTGEVRACAPYGCEPAGCRTNCRFDHDCSTDATCVAGVCVFGPGATAAGGCAFGSSSAGGFAVVVAALGLIASRRRRR